MSSENESSVANFIQKSFEILENKEYEGVIHWMANGREFAIREIDEFQDHILPKFFRHRNINSFIRQLNMYGFHKSRKDPTKNIFSHPYFLRAQPHLLPQVKRKIKADDPREDDQPRAPVRRPNNENIEPEDSIPSRRSLTSMSLLREARAEKEILPTKTEIAQSLAQLSFRSFGLALNP
jgi:heat shock transcription factor 1